MDTTLRTSGTQRPARTIGRLVAVEQRGAPLQVLLAEHDEPPLAGEGVEPVVPDQCAERVQHERADEGADGRRHPGEVDVEVPPLRGEAGEGAG
jgi:hypothetical protein